MSITQLPPNAVQALGAMQCITSAVSVVKELIDNALDAHSTSVSIECSANLLDTIQVRDNGSGIAPADRQLLGKRSCTSKLEKLSDLQNAGSTWLGFRGEALASIAELSAGLSITTKTKDEGIGSLLEVNRKGEITGQRSIASSVGTTVQVKNLFGPVPVRRQVALKQISSSRAQLKWIFQSYSLARPGVRFAFKILDSHLARDSWLYAPRPHHGIKEATHSLLGLESASQYEIAHIEHGGYSITAMLPKRKVDFPKIHGFGCFLSVDARPISNSSVFRKQLMSLILEIWRSVFEDGDLIRNPFVCVSIKCPKACYDINVEPGKDEVLFENAQPCLDAMKKLTADYYGVNVEGSSLEGGNCLQTSSDNDHALFPEIQNQTEEFVTEVTRRSQEFPPREVVNADSASTFNPWPFARMSGTTYPLSPARTSEGSRSPNRSPILKPSGTGFDMSSPFRNRPSLLPSRQGQYPPSPTPSSPRQISRELRGRVPDDEMSSQVQEVSSIDSDTIFPGSPLAVNRHLLPRARIHEDREKTRSLSNAETSSSQQAEFNRKNSHRQSTSPARKRRRTRYGNDTVQAHSSSRDPILQRVNNLSFRNELQERFQARSDRDIRSMLVRAKSINSDNGSGAPMTTDCDTVSTLRSQSPDNLDQGCSSHYEIALTQSKQAKQPTRLTLTLGDLRDFCIRYLDGLKGTDLVNIIGGTTSHVKTDEEPCSISAETQRRFDNPILVALDLGSVPRGEILMWKKRILRSLSHLQPGNESLHIEALSQFERLQCSEP